MDADALGAVLLLVQTLLLLSELEIVLLVSFVFPLDTIIPCH
jgi:hypothetical protein